MTLPTSGTITAAMVNAELGRDPAAAFNLNGTLERTLAGKPSGIITFQDFYGKTKSVTATISANAADVNIQNLFSSGDWTGPADKIVIINAGVYVYGSAYNTYALRTGTGRTGKLYIINNGSILGAGGPAGGYSGGHALVLEQGGIYLENNGNIWSGGGGGGSGGQGGPGYYDTAYTAQDGPFYGSGYSVYQSRPTPANPSGYYSWAGSIVSYSTGTSVVVGGYTYYTGALVSSESGADGQNTRFAYYNYQIYRQYTAYARTYTNGGSGGAAGRGEGFNSANQGGSGGAGGGTNAGTGGTGGTGGTFGNAGSAGGTGAGGNNGGGAGGSAGGPAGYWIVNSASYIASLAQNGSVKGNSN